MTAYQMRVRLMRDRARRSVCIPNFTPLKWWECDVFMLTPAGRWTEFETKVTRADFHADKAKYIRRYSGQWPSYKHEDIKKHDLLAAGDITGPNHFYFVTPPGLLKAEEIPAWAGWMEIGDTSRIYVQTVETVLKKAPLLHSKKVTTKVKIQAAKNCYHRMHTLMSAANMRSTPYPWEPSADNWSI